MRYRSKRKEGQWREYVKKRNKYLDEHPNCEIRSIVCSKVSTCIHHCRGRGTYLSREEFFKSSCNYCNSYLETYEGKKWGKEKGFRLDRIGINP